MFQSVEDVSEQIEITIDPDVSQWSYKAQQCCQSFTCLKISSLLTTVYILYIYN